MRCPRCDATPVPRAEHGVRLFACPADHGALLMREDRGTLTVSARATLETALERSYGKRLACGACGTQADVVVAQRHGDAIELDACAACGGVWFDAGEVARIQARSPRRAGVAPATTPRGAQSLHGGTGHMGFVAIEGIGTLIAALLDGW
ncbi:MAG TPA: zf-TFIIB domain-containing protein [Candidatus Thermoplasmatota archaeon]|nr:zf-TFIIB domain-containing protein [Candidatus Thermoplasmatota archaeon]